jgi:GTPase
MLDKVALKLKAGDGGRGAVTFRHEKFVPFGGPYGGDGGKGGNVIIKADDSLSTLRPYQRRRSFVGENGQSGMNKNKHGKDGANLILTVPPGTLVYRKNESDEQEMIADLEENGQEAVVARGGNGGFGNIHFATATNQTPHIAQPGIPGQEVTVVLELRLIADVGIIGYPNVGKSSLLAALSAAKPKIADYPFTTLEPELGVVKVANSRSFVLAEIPGLIEGAHAGKGLGHEFLRHAMRTRALIHLVDGRSASPLDDMINVNNELALFDATLAKRPQVVAVNKVDLPEVSARVEEITASFKDASIFPIFISACENIGLSELVKETWKLLESAVVREKVLVPVTQGKVFRPKPVDRGVTVKRKGQSFILTDPAVEKLMDKLDLEHPEDLEQFNQQLDKLGINKILKSSGVKNGDTIITGKMEWEWYDEEHRSARRNV